LSHIGYISGETERATFKVSSGNKPSDKVQTKKKDEIFSYRAGRWSPTSWRVSYFKQSVELLPDEMIYVNCGIARWKPFVGECG
jgi:hypothetical protein